MSFENKIQELLHYDYNEYLVNVIKMTFLADTSFSVIPI